MIKGKSGHTLHPTNRTNKRGRAFLSLLVVALFFPFSLIEASSLASPQRHQNSIDGETMQVKDSVDILFQKPEIPLSIDRPHEQALYYLSHFWDDFDFHQGDELLKDAKKKRMLEKDFRDFLTIALTLPLEDVKPLLTIPAQRAEGELFYLFDELYSRYLYDENAPYKNELYYAEILGWYLTSPKIDFATMERTKSTLRLIQRNKPGSFAENFSFVLSTGEVRQLTQYRGRYTLLLFYHPGCEGCRRASAYIDKSEFLNQEVQSGRLHLLYIYPENDSDNFKRSLSTIPHNAQAGINSNEVVINTPLYDLRQSPTVYLLDDKGYVVLKNTSPHEAEAYLAKKSK